MGTPFLKLHHTIIVYGSLFPPLLSTSSFIDLTTFSPSPLPLTHLPYFGTTSSHIHSLSSPSYLIAGWNIRRTFFSLSLHPPQKTILNPISMHAFIANSEGEECTPFFNKRRSPVFLQHLRIWETL